MDRRKVGIVIDFTLRFPEFVSCYNLMKQEVINGELSGNTDDDEINIDATYFKNLSKKCREAYDFYLNTPTPEYNDSFDYSFRNYFFCQKDLEKFLENWSFNLYASIDTLRKNNVEFINICQSKLCDVVLIDKTVNTRKIPITLSFLSKSRVFFKELVWIKSGNELRNLRKDLFDLFDPTEQFENKKIDYTAKENKLLNWLQELEVKLNKE